MNRFYLHDDKSELAGAPLPACVFDETFEQAVYASRQIGPALDLAATLSSERDNLIVERAAMQSQNDAAAIAVAESLP